MKTNILVTVRDRVPEIADGADVITHNSDYTLTFDFDAEWANGVKTVYFAAEDGTYRAVVMNGNSCDVPMLDGEHRRIFVGVQQGTSEKPDVLKTSRPCCLKVVDSIADYVGEQIPDPEPSVYEQIIAMLEKVTTPTWQDVTDKPFETLGDGLEVEDGILSAKGGVELSQTASVGEVLTVEEVDENGRPTKWKTAPAAAEQVQADWQENDDTAASYVKNRPGGFILEKELKVTLEGYEFYDVDGTINGAVGDRINISIDGIINPYEIKENSDGTKYIGDSFDEEPTIGFTISTWESQLSIMNNTDEKHEYKFNCNIFEKIKKQYIPNEAFNINFMNWYAAGENRLTEDEMTNLKTIQLYARKNTNGIYSTDIVCSPRGNLYLLRNYTELCRLPNIVFNSNLDEQNITIDKNKFVVGDYNLLELRDTVTKRRTNIVFPGLGFGAVSGYRYENMQTVAYINNKLFAITIAGAYYDGSKNNTTVNIKKI